jgi:hypothetical protein
VRRFISRIYPLLKQLLAIYQITLSRQKIYVWFFINHSVEQSIPSSWQISRPIVWLWRLLLGLVYHFFEAEAKPFAYI